MTTAPNSPADLSTLATASKTLAEADKTRADAEKVRIEAEKVRAETDTARLDKLIEQVTGAVPDVSSIGKNTVTFGDGRALRQSEAVSSAVNKVAQDVATDVVRALPALDGDLRHQLFVTAVPRLVATISGYWQLSDEATQLSDALTRAQSNAADALDTSAPASGTGDSGGVTMTESIAADVAVAAVAIAGKVVTEVASLFETEVAVTANTGDVAASSVQAAVLHHLLAEPRIDVRHQWTRVPDEDSPLRSLIDGLISHDIELAQTDARLAGAIDALGDPAAALSKATTEANDDKASASERERAGARAKEARERVELLAKLQESRTRLGATQAKVKADWKITHPLKF